MAAKQPTNYATTVTELLPPYTAYQNSHGFVVKVHRMPCSLIMQSVFLTAAAWCSQTGQTDGEWSFVFAFALHAQTCREHTGVPASQKVRAVQMLRGEACSQSQHSVGVQATPLMINNPMLGLASTWHILSMKHWLCGNR
jgi:hypothetical protein